ncbi:MAG: hypothetical protein P8O03_14580 [Ilumatobacter sp.]|nr:hypothetical protein [Ilumatobacter sp.]
MKMVPCLIRSSLTEHIRLGRVASWGAFDDHFDDHFDDTHLRKRTIGRTSSASGGARHSNTVRITIVISTAC